MDMVFELRAEFFGLFASTEVLGVEATDACAPFVETERDRGASPAEELLGLTGRTMAVLEGCFRLKLSAPISGEKIGGQQDGVKDVFRECRHWLSPP
jgi:hypothetical protein